MDHLPWKIATVAPEQQEAGWDFLRSSRGLNALSALVRGMGAEAKKEGIQFGMRDATRVMHLWFQNTPPVTRVEQIGFAFVKSPKGRRALDALVRGIAEALRGSGAQVGYQNVGEVLTSFMAGGKMASNELIWKESAASVSPVDMAKDQATVILEALQKNPQFDGWTAEISQRIQGYSTLVARYRQQLADALSYVAREPEVIQKEGVMTALKDGSFVFEGRVEALQLDVFDWSKKLEEDLAEAKRLHGLVRKLLERGPEVKDWNTPKSEKKGKSRLGTDLTFDVMEITRRGVTWQIYGIILSGFNDAEYRIAPETPGEKGWRIDKWTMGWESVTNRVYSKPQEAAKHLQEMYDARLLK